MNTLTDTILVPVGCGWFRTLEFVNLEFKKFRNGNSCFGCSCLLVVSLLYGALSKSKVTESRVERCLVGRYV